MYIYIYTYIHTLNKKNSRVPKLLPQPERQPFDFAFRNHPKSIFLEASTKYSPFCRFKPMYLVILGARPILHNFVHLGHGCRVQRSRLPLGHSWQELEPWPKPTSADKGKLEAKTIRKLEISGKLFQGIQLDFGCMMGVQVYRNVRRAKFQLSTLQLPRTTWNNFVQVSQIFIPPMPCCYEGLHEDNRLRKRSSRVQPSGRFKHGRTLRWEMTEKENDLSLSNLKPWAVASRFANICCRRLPNRLNCLPLPRPGPRLQNAQAIQRAVEPKSSRSSICRTEPIVSIDEERWSTLVNFWQWPRICRVFTEVGKCNQIQHRFLHSKRCSKRTMASGPFLWSLVACVQMPGPQQYADSHMVSCQLREGPSKKDLETPRRPLTMDPHCRVALGAFTTPTGPRRNFGFLDAGGFLFAVNRSQMIISYHFKMTYDEALIQRYDEARECNEKRATSIDLGLFVCLFVCWFVCWFVCLFVFVCFLFVFVCFFVCFCLFVCLFVCVCGTSEQT